MPDALIIALVIYALVMTGGFVGWLWERASRPRQVERRERWDLTGRWWR
jgi:hypothetical protein